MASLTLPEGKTAADMKAALKAKAEAVAVSDQDSTPERNTGEPAAVSDSQQQPPPGGTREIRWKEADKRIQALRRAARESGKRYEERVAGGNGKHPVVWRS